MNSITVSELITILQKMPKNAEVVYKDYCPFDDEDKLLKANKVSFVSENVPGYLPDEYVILEYDKNVPSNEDID